MNHSSQKILIGSKKMEWRDTLKHMLSSDYALIFTDNLEQYAYCLQQDTSILCAILDTTLVLPSKTDQPTQFLSDIGASFPKTLFIVTYPPTIENIFSDKNTVTPASNIIYTPHPLTQKTIFDLLKL
jgi:hypothetical protein